jgi:hypothetical protein
MGYGELILASASDYNLYLTNKPEITFFKSVFKRHTNFATETIQIHFNNKPDFGKVFTAIIPNDASILSNLSLYIELPSINISKHSILPNNTKKCKWIDKIGIGIIDYIEVEIGGTILERQYSEWLNIWNELTTTVDSRNSYNQTIGNISKLTDYTNGKNKHILHIPLKFWFCLDSGLALPLVALKHHEVKIHVKLNNFNKCVKESPTNYFETSSYTCLFKDNETICQEIDGITTKGEFIYFDVTKQRVYYNKIIGDFKIPTTTNILYKIIGKISKFEIDPKINTEIQNDEKYFYYGDPVIENCYLLADFIFIDKDESKYFINTELKYLVPVLNYTIEKEIGTREYDYKFILKNPTKILTWRAVLKSNIENNDKFNYTTYPLTDEKNNIIENSTITCNSTKLTEINNWEFYYYLQKYLYNLNTTQKGIYLYSFSLNYDKNIPSGSLNFSKIRNSEINLTFNQNINYQNTIYFQVFSLSYNLLTIEEGLGGFKFSN